MKYKATASVILAGVLWGIISLFVRKLSAAGLSSLEITLVRMIVAAFFSICLILFRAKQMKIRFKDLWMFVGTGIISIVLFNLFYFSTMVRAQVSIAVVLLYTSPVFVMLLSAPIFKEKITRRKLLALAMTFLGCVLVAGLTGNNSAIAPMTLLTGLLSGLFYALYTIFGRFALAKYDTLTVTAYTFLFGFIGATLMGGMPNVIHTVCTHVDLIPWCLGVGIICTILPYFLYTWGLRHMESGKAAILVAVEPLVGALLGILLYHESSDPAKLLGIGLIVIAIITLNMPE